MTRKSYCAARARNEARVSLSVKMLGSVAGCDGIGPRRALSSRFQSAYPLEGVIHLG
jgi:hypothetical protein